MIKRSTCINRFNLLILFFKNFNLVNDAKFGGGGVLCSHTYYPSCREAMTIFVVVGNPQPNYAFSFDKHIGCDKIDNT